MKEHAYMYFDGYSNSGMSIYDFLLMGISKNHLRFT